MIIRIKILIVSLLCLSILCTGCSTSDKTSKPENHTKVDLKDKKSDVSKEDGQVISVKKIVVPNASHAVSTYRMMYWSKGNKTEAYVAVPMGNGPYPLFTLCHGGYSVPSESFSHISVLESEGSFLNIDETMLAGADASHITLVPMYQGYGHSEGTVQGLKGATADTENAIKAAKNYFGSNKKYPDINDQLYLSGISLGGGVALNIAAERHDVRSVVAVSPFVGWDIVGAWYQKKNPDLLKKAVDAFGHFDPMSTAYKEQSVDYKNISAPTLLIQGKVDNAVPWQTVQTFYKKMKSNHQDVTFKLIPEGNHGMSNVPDKMNQILTQWYSQRS